MSTRSRTFFAVGLVIAAGVIAHQWIKFQKFKTIPFETLVEYVHNDDSFKHRFGNKIVSNVLDVDDNSTDSTLVLTIEVLGSRDSARIILQMRETKYGGWKVKNWRDTNREE